MDAIPSSIGDSPRAGHRIQRPLPALTSIRFFAAIWVVIYHFCAPAFSKVGNADVMEGGIHCGFMGVSLFYVLSGYILTYVYYPTGTNEMDRVQFLRARFARIYPAYFLSFLIEIPLLLAVVFTSDEVLKRFVIFSVSLFANLLMIQSWDLVIRWRWNPPAWSVSAEAFFYIVFALGGLKFVRILRSMSCLTLAAAALTTYTIMLLGPTCLLAFGAGLHDVRTPMMSQVMFSPVFRIPEFILGIIVYMVRSKIELTTRFRHYSTISAISIFVGLAFLAIVFINYEAIPFIFLHQGLGPAFALIIFGLGDSHNLISKIMSFSPLVVLGEASYAIYILQAPVYGWLIFLNMGRYFGGIDSVAFAIFFLSLLVIVSLAVHKFWELPLRNWMNSISFNRVTAFA